MKSADRRPPRLLPRRELPAYSYVSGHFPHPTSDPDGHSFSIEHTKPPPPEANAWQNCEAYLWGIDLFNNGFYWEAHESWEAVWIAAERRGLLADFLKALIKLAAAGVKAREARRSGIERHLNRAIELLASVQSRLPRPSESFMGLQLEVLAEKASRLVETVDEWFIADNDVARIVMPLDLVPG